MSIESQLNYELESNPRITRIAYLMGVEVYYISGEEVFAGVGDENEAFELCDKRTDSDAKLSRILSLIFP